MEDNVNLPIGKQMLYDAIELYGDEKNISLSEWNAKKKTAERAGTWQWKVNNIYGVNAAIRSRIHINDSADEGLQKRLYTVHREMQKVLPNGEIHCKERIQTPRHERLRMTSCSWSKIINNIPYYCLNRIAIISSSTTNRKNYKHKVGKEEPSFCFWHIQKCCYKFHDRVVEDKLYDGQIEIANEYGYCLRCYEATAISERKTLRKVPIKYSQIHVPGVVKENVQLQQKKDSLLLEYHDKQRELKQRNKQKHCKVVPVVTSSKQLEEHKQEELQTNKNTKGIERVCSWSKEDPINGLIWRCNNLQLICPYFTPSDIVYCGYHVPWCVQNLQLKKTDSSISCPVIDEFNEFGLCKKHLAAKLAYLPISDRSKIKKFTFDLDIPNIYEATSLSECMQVKPHPLAPRESPLLVCETTNLTSQLDLQGPHSVTQDIGDEFLVLRHIQNKYKPQEITIITNVKVMLIFIMDALRYLIWIVKYYRTRHTIICKVQSRFRARKARQRMICLRNERQALKRIRANRQIQRVVRGFLGRQAFKSRRKEILSAILVLQRYTRGFLVRLQRQKHKATSIIQRAYEAKCQRRGAISILEELNYMKALQIESEANLKEVKVQLNLFRRIRARRLIRRFVQAWKLRFERQADAKALQILLQLSCIKIQHWYRRNKRYETFHRRYNAAQMIQKRVRGWLTRFLWADDPGILFLFHYQSQITGFRYGRVVVLPQLSHSYSFRSQQIRMLYAALCIQRLYRGLLGRIKANSAWVYKLKQRDWIETKKLRRGLEIKHNKRDSFCSRAEGDNTGSSNTDKDLANRKKIILKKKNELRKRRLQGSSIVMHQAQFPLGSHVSVMQPKSLVNNRFSSTKHMHLARIVAIHCMYPNDDEKFTQICFDVEYDKGLTSMRGVRIYSEKRVSISRLHHPTLTLQHNNELTRYSHKSKLTSIIKSEILRLQNTTLPSSNSKIISKRINTSQCKSVSEIIERLLNTDPQSDILGESAFTEFCFRNYHLLNRYWTEIFITLVRKRFMNHPVILPSPKHAQILQGKQLDRGETSIISASCKGKPNRIKEILRMMKTLGFQIDIRIVKQHFISAYNIAYNNLDIQGGDSWIDQYNCVNYMHNKNSPEAKFLRNNGDICCHEFVRPRSTDLKQLSHIQIQEIYSKLHKFKALQWFRARDGGYVVASTRDYKKIICCYPGCGMIFHSTQAFRNHKITDHKLTNSYLAIALPETDQYFHAFWPNDIPWRINSLKINDHCGSIQDTLTSGVHLNLQTMNSYPSVHSVTCPQTDRPQKSPPLDIIKYNANRPPRHSNISNSSNQFIRENPQILWLGSYVVCWRLEKRMEMLFDSKPSLNELSYKKPSTLHLDKVICQNLEMPCRLYSTIAIKFTPSNDDSQILSLYKTNTYVSVLSRNVNTYIVSSTCRHSQPHYKKATTLNIRPVALVRDVRNGGWLIGRECDVQESMCITDNTSTLLIVSVYDIICINCIPPNQEDVSQNKHTDEIGELQEQDSLNIERSDENILID